MIRYHRNRPSVVLWESILNETDYSEQYTRTALEVHMPNIQVINAMRPVTIIELLRLTMMSFTEQHFVIIRDLSSGSGETIIWSRRVQGIRISDVQEGQEISTQGESGMLQSSKERTDILNNILATKGLSGGALWTGIDTNRGYYDNIAACVHWIYIVYPNIAIIYFKAKVTLIYKYQEFVQRQWYSLLMIGLQLQRGILRFIATVNESGSILNGRLLGVKKPDASYGSMPHAPFIFEGVEWEPGKLMAEAIVDDVIVATHAVMTPGMRII